MRTNDIAENGCSAAPEEPLPRAAPSPLAEKKDPKLREDRRPITVHFGQGLSRSAALCGWQRALKCMHALGSGPGSGRAVQGARPQRCRGAPPPRGPLIETCCQTAQTPPAAAAAPKDPALLQARLAAPTEVGISKWFIPALHTSTKRGDQAPLLFQPGPHDTRIPEKYFVLQGGIHGH
ncbi:hypothetical protein DV515_00013311 [Chloebia gouldiae]|uniref:Uncharacterized protein n=1 Tax=Chloebia gouldiae TaxID=44316 RepID=A0A3L8S2B8_CHLGU|nr:hypothetical protein DV515_00013311 [Chloebia gouldiae]